LTLFSSSSSFFFFFFLLLLLTSPWGIAAARLLFCRLRYAVRLLGLIDLGDCDDLKWLGLVLGGS